MNKISSLTCEFQDGASSFVTGFNYNYSNQELVVYFKNNKSYRYFGVPENIVENFMVAESKGKFLHENLKDKYAGTPSDLQLLNESGS